MALYFKCPACKQEHRSSYGLDKKSFEDPSTTLSGNSEQCPVTGKMVTYDKKDMFWKD